MTKRKAKELEDGTLEISVVVQKLPCKLDEKGIALAGVRLAAKLQQHGEFELQAKGVRDGLKQQESAIQNDIDAIAAAIRAGSEVQDVEVSVRADFERGVAEFVRADTGETITKRTLTDDERQKKMIFDIEETDEAEDEAAETDELPKEPLNFLEKLKDEMSKNGEEPPASA